LQLLHLGTVTAVACSPDGTLVATGGVDGLIRISDGRTLALRETIDSPGGGLMRLQFSSDGSQLLATNDIEGVRIFDLRDGLFQREWGTHGGGSEAGLSPDGKRFYALLPNGEIRAFKRNGSDGNLYLTRPAYPAGEGGALVLSSDGTMLLTSGSDGLIRWWDPALLEPLGSVRVPTGKAHRLALTPDGQLLAAGGDDGRIHLWNVETLKDGRRAITGSPRVLGSSAEGLRAIHFSADGTLLSTAGTDGVVRVWDPASGAELLTLRGHQGQVNALAFQRGVLPVSGSTPQGALLSVGVDSTVRIWDLRTGTLRRTLGGFTAAVSDLAYAPNGEFLAVLHGDRRLRFRDSRRLDLLRVTPAHRTETRALAISPDSRVVATGGGTFAEEIHLWEAATGRELRELPAAFGPCYDLSFSPDGTLLASAGYGAVRVYRVSDGKLLHSFPGVADQVTTVAFSPEGRILAATWLKGVLRTWRCANWEEGRTFEMAPSRLWDLAFSPDGAILVVAAGAGGRVLDAHTASVLRRLAGSVTGSGWPRGERRPSL
jgi:WD40 repeat protein